MYSKIIGTGSYLPERVLINLELEGMVDTTDEWILRRTGIARGHLAAAGLVPHRINPKDLLLLEAFGGGFTWGSALVRL
jgi:3-oxoacyl-[acyl-carrier-protein] synthase III